MNRALFNSLVAISSTESPVHLNGSVASAGGSPVEVATRRNSLPAPPIFKPFIQRQQHMLHSTINGNVPPQQNSSSRMTNDRTPVIAECTKRASEARELLKKADIVCFDVDSTVITEEGIDELAQFCGKGSEVAALTKEAMGGSMTFQDALKRRLDIIKPSQKQIREFLKTYPSTVSAGVRELIDQLRQSSAEIYLISGGFDCLIEPVADALDIPLCNLFANKLYFHYNGSYAGFDTNQVTSKSGGKGEAIKIVKSRFNSDTIVAMIGDGMTDLEACPPANFFIGYGGNVVREEVQKRATHYVTNFADLLW
ncbi:phosphoserine phosphatase isoform X2 [Toxorhynchites rutilus septentrionalis]|uniref:phosphoserine phosphatase isoform X2 n=1 Tax=Toxorhynchites rutilus septentrionalis TaxID=329112 RepID=UPI002479A191|nr:phosphoserine phosphatase isoform X2 [Toxorhynchites rutilus septentrionalis]